MDANAAKGERATLAAWPHPEGTPCVVRRDDGSELATATRSAAWMLGGHTAVVLVDGISGAYLLSRVRLAKTAA